MIVFSTDFFSLSVTARQFFKQASAIVLSRIGVDTRLLEQSSCTPFAIDNNKLCPQFTLPKKLPSGLSLHVMDTCTGIEACLALDLKVVKRSFKAWIVIDPCKFTFSLGFEKWVMKKTLSLSLWGELTYGYFCCSRSGMR